MALGLFAAALDFSNVAADEFHDWYDHEHNPQRLNVPGFLNAIRWVGHKRPTVSIALYDLADVAVMSTPAFAAIGGANGTPWTKRVMSKVTRLLRYEGSQVLPGDGVGPGSAKALRLVATSINQDQKAAFKDWLVYEHVPALADLSGLCGMRYYFGPKQKQQELIVYYLDHVAVLDTKSWKDCVDAAWTKWVRPLGDETFVVDATLYVRR